MNQDMTLAMRLFADATGFIEGVDKSDESLEHFVEGAKSRVEGLHSAYEQLERRLASVGVAIGALEVARESAVADRDFTRIQLSAGATREEVEKLREEIAAMARETGNSEEALRQGFAELHEGGLNWEASRHGIDAVNKALADGGGAAGALADALTQAQESFDWDLSKPEAALKLMDKLTAVSRQGPANRDTLSAIFAEQASNARAGGFSPDEALALIEGVARSEPNAGRLQGMARGVFGAFGNLQQRQRIQFLTGVQFNDADGQRRDPLAVLADLQKNFAQYKSSNDQDFYLEQVFGATDARARRAFRDLLSRDRIDYIRNVARTSAGSEGTIEKDLPEALSNAADEANRLKRTLNDAAEEFARPINHALSEMIKFGMAKKDEGGLGLTGGDLIEDTLLAYLGVKAGGKLLGKIFKGKKGAGTAAADALGRFGNLAEGIATGEALAKIGVTPVYVVNMPGGGTSGSPSLDVPTPGMPELPPGAKGAGRAAASWKYLRGAWRMLSSAGELSAIAELGPEAIALAGGLVTAAGGVGYGAGTLGYKGLLESTTTGDRLGGMMATILAGLGNRNAQAALDREFSPHPVELTIGFRDDGRPYIDSVKTPPGGPLIFKPGLGPNANGSGL